MFECHDAVLGDYKSDAWVTFIQSHRGHSSQCLIRSWGALKVDRGDLNVRVVVFVVSGDHLCLVFRMLQHTTPSNGASSTFRMMIGTLNDVTECMRGVFERHRRRRRHRSFISCINPLEAQTLTDAVVHSIWVLMHSKSAAEGRREVYECSQVVVVAAANCLRLLVRTR